MEVSNMYILIWKNKYGNIESIRIIRDKSKRDLFNNIARLDRGDKYLTIAHCDEYKILYNSGTGWIK